MLIKDNQYGDLILFYNTIFAPLIGSTARQFSSNTDHNLNTGPLSPLPVSVLKIAGSGALLLVSGLDIE